MVTTADQADEPEDQADEVVCSHLWLPGTHPGHALECGVIGCDALSPQDDGT